MTAELIRICDLAGRPRGSGFVADDCGTVVTSHAAVDGLSRLLLSGTGTSTGTGTGPGAGERTWLAGASDVTALPELGLALVRSDGLGVRPLPVALRAEIAPGTYVRLCAHGWRQARVLGGAEARYAAATGCHTLPAALELAIGTDGQDALRRGGEACGGPVLDAGTGAVLAVLATALRTEHRSGGFAVPLAAAAAADPGGPLAALLRRNAATVPGHGADLNLAGVLQLTGTTLGAAFAARGPELVDRPDTAAALDTFATGDRPVLALVGRPGTGRTTALSDLALRRTRGPHPAPTLWLRGADLRTGDTSLADAVARALAEAGRILSVPGPSGAAWGFPAAAAAAPAAPAASAGVPAAAGAEAATAAAWAAPSPAAPSAVWTVLSPTAPSVAPPPPAPPAPDASEAVTVAVPVAAPPSTQPAAQAPAGGAGEASAVAAVAALAGRGLLVVLDSPEEMPPRLAHGLGPWTEATAGWLRAAGVRLVLAARPEHWESAGALYPPQMLHLPARPARRLPPALPIGDLTPDEAALARTRLGIPADAVDGADARHPLTLRLLADVRAAGVTTGRPAREEVFAAHLDLLCLRIAVRVCAALPAAGQDTGVHGPGVGRLAARVAGRVHEAARRCLGPGQGQLDRAGFEELFPWRTGWASAVLTEGLLVPAGEGYRFAHEELSDWLQSGHLDLPAALETLDALGRGVPRHRIGPVLEALLRLPRDEAGVALARLVAVLEGATDPEIRWWAGRLVREILLHAPDATGHLPLLHALAEHVTEPRAGVQEEAQAEPGEDFGGWFWNRLQLAEGDRFELLRRLTARDHRYLDAAARRLVRAPRLVQPLLCGWFADERRLHGRPGATVATAAQALLHTHRQLAVDDLAEALVVAAHPRADELLAVLAEDEPSALCRAVDRWAHDDRPGRRVAAAAYGLLTAPHVRTPADRELLRYSAEALLARPDDATLHGSALGIMLRDPGARARHLPEALACFRDPERRTRLPAASLVAALPVLPDPDAVFAALRDRADGEVVRALAALTTPGLARRAGDLVREHLSRNPQDAAHAAEFVDRRLEQGLAAAPVLRPLVLELLRTGPPGVRAALASVLAAPGTEASHTLRGELADVLLREECDPAVLDAFLGALAAGAAVRPQGRTRELLRRTGRRLLCTPGGPAVFELRTVELARAEPAFGALAARWLAEAPAEAAALLGPGARRTVETLGHTTSQSTSRQADADDGPRPPAWQS